MHTVRQISIVIIIIILACQFHRRVSSKFNAPAWDRGGRYHRSLLTLKFGKPLFRHYFFFFNNEIIKRSV